jgi:hypothetical protein
MIEGRTILLAGEPTRVLLHDILSEGTWGVRFLTSDEVLASILSGLGVEVVLGSLHDPASVRAAAKGCYAVIAATDTVAEGRTVIKVVGGSEVERFLLTANVGREELQVYSQTVGNEPVFVDLDSLATAASIYLQESLEGTWRTSSLPFFL